MYLKIYKFLTASNTLNKFSILSQLACFNLSNLILFHSRE